jgi:hypothetical protein
MSGLQTAMYRAWGRRVAAMWYMRDQDETRTQIKHDLREMRRLRYPGYAVARYRPRTQLAA